MQNCLGVYLLGVKSLLGIAQRLTANYLYFKLKRLIERDIELKSLSFKYKTPQLEGFR
jgi:hypothetical protein